MSKIVLCADDSATMQMVAEITFRGSEWSYVGARSLDEALAVAKKDKPALVLADSLLGGSTGYELCKAIKGEPSLQDVPVILMCGNSEAYDETRGSQAGADGHVTKPWDTQKLLDQLDEMLSKGAAKPAPVASAPVASPPVAAPPIAAPTPPRSATLMGMPALEMPPSKPLPAGVAAIKPPPTPAVKPVAVPSIAAPVAAKPAALAPIAAPATEANNRATTPAPIATPAPVAKPLAAAPVVEAAASRPPMISGQPSKPIRLVLASQAQAAATQTAQAQGLTSDQAVALTAVSREVLEQVIWEVVPDLAEAIIRENLDTLAAKAR